MKRAVAARPREREGAPGARCVRVQPGRRRRRPAGLAPCHRADPKNVEAYYDLGFLYVSRTPPDMAEAKKMWGKVVALAPRLRPWPRRLPCTSRGWKRRLPLPRHRLAARGDRMTEVGIPIAFLAGIVSFASPCCLPLVPGYVSYMVATNPDGSAASRRTALLHSLAFVAGFSVVFIAIWASVGLIGYLFRDYVGLLRQLGGAVLVFMGLHVAGVINISALYREKRLPIGPGAAPRTVGGDASSEPSYARSAMVGVVFSAGWTPCIGPILGGIIGLASVSASVAQGTAPAARLRDRPGHPLRPRRAGRHRGQRAAQLAPSPPGRGRRRDRGDARRDRLPDDHQHLRATVRLPAPDRSLRKQRMSQTISAPPRPAASR